MTDIERKTASGNAGAAADAGNREAGPSRRDVLQGAVAGASMLGAAGLAGCEDAASQTTSPTPPVVSNAGAVFGADPATRASQSASVNMAAITQNMADFPTTAQTNNGDEAMYADFRASFSKTLRHNALGEVEPASFDSFLQALSSGNQDDFDNIIVGNPGVPGRNRLVSPQAAYAFEIGGLDGQGGRMPAAPTFASDETAAEMAELYWYALCRDVPFINYDTDPLIAAAVADLNALTRSDIFPSEGGQVTPQTIFRGGLPGATTGPMLSQFLIEPFFLGAFEIDQRYRRVAEGGVNDFMTSFTDYLVIQQGAQPSVGVTFDANKTYLYSLRQLGEFVHVDFPIQSGTYAASILMGLGAFDPGIPLLTSDTEQGFADFGTADILHLVVRGPRHGLTAAWYQKWLAHRRLRPENYACRLNVMQRGLATYDIHPDILNSDGLARINAAQATADDRGLLPMGYPEGCPAHPAYPGGHSTFVAAAATICKGFFDENFVFPNPIQPSADGLSTTPWTGAPLTVGGELNKLVGNITHGRDGAGMHWRSDGLGNFIGETIGISILADYSRTYNERFDGFVLTRFDGATIRINNGVVSTI